MPKASLSRRHVLTFAGVAGLGVPVFAATSPSDESYPKDADAALQQLKAGNTRFANGETRHAHQGANWRNYLVAEQKPFATILGCSDSRVPPELVFDQGFGDLFVVRVAGNVIATDVVGSIAYAALHLKTPLFMVLGHTGCGAVTAALDAKLKGAKEPERIEALVKLIDPALTDLDPKLEYSALLDSAIESNVRWSIKQLRDLPYAKREIAAGRIKLVGGVYDLATGKVRLLDS